MLERWPQVCHIKITCTVLPTNRFVSTTNKNDEMRCKVDSTESPRSFEKYPTQLKNMNKINRKLHSVCFPLCLTVWIISLSLVQFLLHTGCELEEMRHLTQHTATRCNKLSNIATLCNTLPHTQRRMWTRGDATCDTQRHTSTQHLFDSLR